MLNIDFIDLSTLLIYVIHCTYPCKALHSCEKPEHARPSFFSVGLFKPKAPIIHSVEAGSMSRGTLEKNLSTLYKTHFSQTTE